MKNKFPLHARRVELYLNKTFSVKRGLIDGLIVWCLTPLTIVFQLYRSGHSNLKFSYANSLNLEEYKILLFWERVNTLKSSCVVNGFKSGKVGVDMIYLHLRFISTRVRKSWSVDVTGHVYILSRWVRVFCFFFFFYQLRNFIIQTLFKDSMSKLLRFRSLNGFRPGPMSWHLRTTITPFVVTKQTSEMEVF